MDAPGTVVGLTGGSQSLFQGTLRHASRLGRRFGLKVSAQYLRGTDWVYVDSTELQSRQNAIAGGADPETLLIGARDPDVQHAAGELQFEWRPSDGTSWITSVGASDALSNVALTPLGAAQVNKWKYYYLQTRLSHGRLFTQAFVNINNAGETYLLRNGNTVVDRSLMLVGQVQHAATAGRSVILTYGLDLQSTIPRTDSTITGRNEDDDTINEAGAYLHSETVLHHQLDLVAALRLDYHNRIENLVLSPRAALVFRPAASHALRFTYNRAFSTPNTNNLSLDLFGDSLRVPGDAPPPFAGATLPYAVRLEGVPETGYTFDRSCAGGLCMRSPFTPASVGQPTDYIAAEATQLWSSVVDSLAKFGIDLSAIPAPTSADVETELKRLDIASGSYALVSDVADIPALRPTITNTLELGYRGVIAERLSLAADVYYTWKTDFISAEQVETPNAFYDVTTLAQYLASFLPPDQALGIAAVMAQLPVGTVVPQQAFDPWDIIVTYRNFGKITLWGADLDLTAFLSRHFALRGTYSWVSRDTFAVVNPVGRPDTILLNAPTNKGSVALLFRDDMIGLNAQVRWRGVERFPVRSGVYAGEVPGYGVWDIAIGYRLPWRYDLLVVLSARNVLDNEHQEFVGAAPIGRLVTLRLRAGF
jgi:iron complex outermembrane receptor protein